VRRLPERSSRRDTGANLSDMTSDSDWPLTQEEFQYIYSKVPRLTVELLVRNRDGAVFLTKRSTGPCRGQWHFPGGTVQYGESLFSAVRRVAKRELAIDVEEAVNCGYIEYPSHYLKGIDSPVGLAFAVTRYTGIPTSNSEALGSGWFAAIPEAMHADQDTFLMNKVFASAEPTACVKQNG
jgi:ADP-ribose pyrophosphatase YjhB (NUDIX family)